MRNESKTDWFKSVEQTQIFRLQQSLDPTSPIMPQTLTGLWHRCVCLRIEGAVELFYLEKSVWLSGWGGGGPVLVALLSPHQTCTRYSMRAYYLALFSLTLPLWRRAGLICMRSLTGVCSGLWNVKYSCSAKGRFQLMVIYSLCGGGWWSESTRDRSIKLWVSDHNTSWPWPQTLYPTSPMMHFTENKYVNCSSLAESSGVLAWTPSGLCIHEHTSVCQH